jgi:hypothetical protein
VEDWYRHPLLVIATLVAIGAVNLANIKLSSDPEVVRPDPWTGTEGRANRAAIEELHRLLRENTARDSDWRADHLEWGNSRSIVQQGINERHEAQIQELQRHMERPHP